MKTMRRIALFRLGSGTEHIATDVTEKYSPDVVRVSEYVDVEFAPVDESLVAEALERQRQATIAYHRGELAKLAGSAEVVSLAKRQAE